MDILDITKHPVDSNSILNWMLWRWEQDPQAALMIITHEGDGTRLNNRLRVRLSTARTALRKGGIKEFKQFGIETTLIAWTMSDGTRREALCLTRIVLTRHVVASVLATMSLTVPTKG